MRLVLQVSLYFCEGNSDKVYEIDLCSVGNDLYVVNFRYGRRGAVLKEGTKTPNPVSLYKAEEIYQTLEAEKRGKGYQAVGEAGQLSTLSDLVNEPVKPQLQFAHLPTGRRKAILERLQAAVDGKADNRFRWKTSRVIWLAGVMRLEEAIDAILYLAKKSDMMQQYAALWSLGRCHATGAIPLFQSYFNTGKGALQRLAGAALLAVASGNVKERQLQFYLRSLPEPILAAVENKDEQRLLSLLQERVLEQVQSHYNFLEDLYLLSQEQVWIRRSLNNVLASVPFKPSYFRHVRHIFKLAEFFDDFEVIGMLSHRFEREEEMFRLGTDDSGGDVYVTALSAYVNPQKELAKKSSRLAFSNKTKRYLVRRTLRSLKRFGELEDLRYVRLATALLLAYDQAKDASEPSSTYRYVWRNNKYERVETRFPVNATAVFLNHILYGNSNLYHLQWNNVWVSVDPQATKTGSKSDKGENTGGGLIRKIIGFITGKKQKNSVASTHNPSGESSTNKTPEAATEGSEVPHLLLWNQLPQAYVQLLMHGRMDDVQRFALTNLQKHPDFSSIKNKLDAATIEQLLLSDFPLPAEFAFSLAQERFDPSAPDLDLVKAMLYGRLVPAQQKAQTWVEANKDFFLSDAAFVAALLICPNAYIRQWMDRLLAQQVYTTDAAKEIAQRAIMHVLAVKENTPDNNKSIQDAAAILIRHFAEALRTVNLQVVEHLLKSSVAGAQLLGIDVLLLQRENINLHQLSNELIAAAIHQPFAPLREKGMQLLTSLHTPELLQRQELIIHCCTSNYSDVRKLVRPILKRMAEQQPLFGVQAAEWLLPFLLRKESSEGLHQDVADMLRHELIQYIKDANKELVLRLLYSAYVPTQEFAIKLLQTHIDPKDLTIGQIIALGNHETRSVREWVWQYFENNVSRIRYEREEAIRLLDARWDDTREFAKTFFRHHFEERDWSPEVLVALADSVRPDVEAFGRELITRFFRDEKGEEYLIKLSQHPSEKMQLFATNYLERFAAGDVQKLQSLEFYFRSVLTRVNKARVAKIRIFRFLAAEGKGSEAAAQFVAGLISQVSATVSIEDKAKCIEILLALQSLYDVQTPIKKKQVEERI